MMRRYWPVLALAALVAAGTLAIIAVRSKPDHQLAARTKLIVQLQWTPSAQFLGFYVAREQQFYAEEQLDVEFLHGGPEVNPIAQIVNETAHVGLATGDQVVLWTAQNVKDDVGLKAIGTVFKGSLARFMSDEARALRTPDQLLGKRVGVFPTYDTDNLLRILLKRHDIPPDKVNIVAFPNLAQFEKGDLDAFPAYVINEPVLERLRGRQVHLLDPETFGVRFYSDTVITTTRFHRDHRDTLKRFLRASARGWTLAETDLPRALDSMFREVGSAIGPGEPWAHQQAVAQETIKHLHTGSHELMFRMERPRWEEMEAALAEIGRLPKRVTVDTLCDFEIAAQALAGQ